MEEPSPLICLEKNSARVIRIPIHFENGLHLTPSGLMAREFGKYNSDFFINFSEDVLKKANLKNAMEVMCLGISRGSILDLIVIGDEETHIWGEEGKDVSYVAHRLAHMAYCGLTSEGAVPRFDRIPYVKQIIPRIG